MSLNAAKVRALRYFAEELGARDRRRYPPSVSSPTASASASLDPGSPMGRFEYVSDLSVPPELPEIDVVDVVRAAGDEELELQQQAAAGKTVIINKAGGTTAAKPAEAKPVKKKEGDEFKNADPKW